MFIKYLTMTAFAYGIDLSIYTACFFYMPFLHPVLASIIGKIISSIFSLFAHRFFTFKKSANQSSLTQQAWRYGALVAINTPINALVFILVLGMIKNPFATKIMTDIACLSLSYLLSKYKIFTAIP